jgi:class 3 adenylate cyclase/CHASE2 domain-containing sensor protein
MKLRDGAVALIASLLVTAFVVFPANERIQGYSIDLLFWLRNAVSAPVIEPSKATTAVVAIDERTYRTPPFEGVPRIFWTQQIAEVLEALVDAGATVVGFDLVLSTSVEPFVRGHDRPLRLALKKAATGNKVILGTLTLGEHPIEPLEVYRLIVRGNNIRPLNVVSGAGGIVRHVPLLFRRSSNTEGRYNKAEAPQSDLDLIPSMSLAMASRHLGVKPEVTDTGAVSLDGHEIPAAVDQQMRVSVGSKEVVLANDLLVDLYQGPASIPTYSFADLYHCLSSGNEDFFREHFAGKAIVFGTTLDVEDRKLTSIRFAQKRAEPNPLNNCSGQTLTRDSVRGNPGSRRSIPGAYLHAAAIENLVSRKVFRPFNPPVQLGIAAIAGFAMALFAMLSSSLWASLAFGAGVAGWIAVATAAFMAGWVLPLFQPILAGAVSFAVILGYRFTVTDRIERHIRKAFGRILSPSLVDSMVELKQLPSQGGEMRNITVWMADLENYTAISEALSPSQVVEILNEVYTVMSDTIEEYDGFVAQFQGDAVVAAFGIPLEDPDHARHGVEAAMACRRRVDELSQHVSLPQGLRLRVRLGVSTGPLLVGYIGSKRRLSYTVIGDDINLASRLEGVNKVYGSTVLVNEVTKSVCGPEIIFREIDIVRVKGRDEPVRIFEPLGMRGSLDPTQEEDRRAFAEALAAFRARQFDKAVTVFEMLGDKDPVARAFVTRAKEMIAHPPSDDWDGVNTLTTK